MNFAVSVVIPVYNGERFIEKAIVSALQQSEVSEVIVVNDGSTDSTLHIVKKLRIQEKRVQIFNHNKNQNKGRSASRNLGITNATGNYIAFLDADDYYLPNRFFYDKKIFESKKAVDGVYNAIGAKFYRETTKAEKSELELFTINKKVEPKNLFDSLVSGKNGYFSIDGLTVKRTVFEKTGLFNDKLEVAEDTDLIWKMTLKCNLAPGILNQPVAMRGVHNENVFSKKKLYEVFDLKLYESLFSWSSKNSIEIKTAERFLERIWILKFRQNKNIFSYLVYWVRINLIAPSYFFTYLGIKYCPLIRQRKKLFPLYFKN